MHYPYSMGETAENVAERWGVPRERQDAFALESQERAVAAIEAGRFDGQLVPVQVTGRKGEVTVVDRDEHPRADTSLEALGRLKPAFKREGGSVAITATSILGDADRVIVEGQGRSTTVRGEPYDNRYCFVLTMAEGRIVRLTEYMDSALVERRLTAPGIAG